jgi:hypothetical protein
MKDPKMALYVTGGLVLLMGLWGLVVSMGWMGEFAGVKEVWWHSLGKILVGGWAVWVASQQK